MGITRVKNIMLAHIWKGPKLAVIVVESVRRIPTIGPTIVLVQNCGTLPLGITHAENPRAVVLHGARMTKLVDI